MTTDNNTIDVSSLNYGSITQGTWNTTITNAPWAHAGNVTIGGAGSNYHYNYPTTAIPSIYTTSNTGNQLHVSGDAEFDGDIKVKGRSLEKMLQKIEDRLAIISDPDPAKLEKFAALKKAYEHYKTLERLIGED